MTGRLGSNTLFRVGLVQLFFVKRSFQMFAQRLKLWRPKLEAAGAVVAEVCWHTALPLTFLMCVLRVSIRC